MSDRDDNLERAKDVVIIFLAGVAIVLGLCLVSYFFAMFMDRYGGWICQEGIPPLSDEQLATRRRAAPLTIQAGLAGVTKDERQKILDYFFSHNSSYEYGSGQGDPEHEIKEGVVTTEEIDIENPDGKSSCLSKTGPDASCTDHSEETEGDGEPKGNSNKETNGSGKKSLVKDSQAKVSDSSASIPQGNAEETDNAEGASAGEILSENNNETTRNEEEDVELQELCMMEHKEGTCPICLMEYAPGEKVMTGTNCTHLFHYECAMQWLCKKHHYHCPLCRKDMLTVSELRKAAEYVLGEERLNELVKYNMLASIMFHGEENSQSPPTLTPTTAGTLDAMTPRPHPHPHSNSPIQLVANQSTSPTDSVIVSDAQGDAQIESTSTTIEMHEIRDTSIDT